VERVKEMEQQNRQLSDESRGMGDEVKRLAADLVRHIQQGDAHIRVRSGPSPPAL
jgi:hypothetical protein